MLDFKNESLLVISPHADDEVLGCGGLMDKIKKSGGSVYALIFNVGSVVQKMERMLLPYGKKKQVMQ